MNATVNPDFSTVEADAVQLDVNNQFALFFNETRPFFLEGSDFFRTARMNLLHTRQIADPNGALKISGKTGRHAFGVFSAHDEATSIIVPGIQESETLDFERQTLATVGRYRFDTGGNSTVGAMVTDRRGAGYSNSVVAVDARQRLTSTDSINATVAMSSTRDIGDIAAETSTARRSDAAADVVYEHSVRTWYTYGYFGNLGKDFRTDLGFITQVDKRVGEIGGGRTWHGDPSKFYNRIQISGNVDQTHDQGGDLFEREAEGYLSYNGRMESFLQFGGGRRSRVHDGVRYEQTFNSAHAEFRPSRTAQLGGRIQWGDWIDFDHSRAADQRTIRGWLNLNTGRHIAVRVSHLYDILDVAGGRLFAAHVPELRVVYQRDLRTLFRAIVQYTGMTRDLRLYDEDDEEDAESRDLFAQLLFSYKVNAQTALYFGYTSGVSGTDRFAMTHEKRTLFAKLSYAWLR
jgi:hypothetical protein